MSKPAQSDRYLLRVSHSPPEGRGGGGYCRWMIRTSLGHLMDEELEAETRDRRESESDGGRKMEWFKRCRESKEGKSRDLDKMQWCMMGEALMEWSNEKP